MVDYSKMTRDELIAYCKEHNVKGYSGKKKGQIIQLLTTNTVVEVPMPTTQPIQDNKLAMIDLFAGTGAFSYAFEGTKGAKVVFANDMVEHSKKIYDSNFDHKLTLEDLNDVKLEVIPKHDILTGGFPCFVAGSKVLTDSGYKNIEDVVLSDKLLTHTGKFQKILNLQKKDNATNMNTIKIMYRPYPIQCTSEHPFYVRERMRQWDNSTRSYKYAFEEPKWVEAKHITDNHYSGTPVNTDSIIPTVAGLRIDSVDQWFMMGYFLGDGWIEESKKESGRPKNIIRFAINNKDEKYVVERINNVLPITNKKCATGKSEKFGCSNKDWYTVLKQFGKYSHGKKVPEWVHSAPIEFVNAFIDGYRTADGSFDKKAISYTTVSENIAFSIQRLYLKLGVFCSIDYTKRPATCIIEGRTVNQRNTYRMRVTMNPEKSYTSFISGSHAWFKVKSNKPNTLIPQTVYNFEVQNDNSYCVENSLVHNCQPFSIAGRQEGFEDTRSNVFWKILKIIDHHGPKAVILENVKNLVSHDEGKTFKTITTNLKDRGYHLCYKVLNTAEITGIPQHRERIYIVCIKSKKVFDKFNLNFDKKDKKRISEFLEKNVPSKYYYTDASSTWPLVKAGVTKKDTIYQYRRVYVRENKSSECPTLTANMGGGGHNVPLVLDEKGIRKLTPRECFNFQGFPSSYILPQLSDSNLYKLAGNAVSVPVVKLIADRIIPLLLDS
jgi:DNA (cytosine-5)-methyltransferase 1